MVSVSLRFATVVGKLPDKMIRDAAQIMTIAKAEERAGLSSYSRSVLACFPFLCTLLWLLCEEEPDANYSEV